MNSVLSVIGLALDFVGAVFIVVGLFRPARPTYTGFAYAPDDAARDAAFGFAGGSLLLAGFVVQSLPYFGFSPRCASWVNATAWAIALVVGLAWALVVYEITHRLVFDRRLWHARSENRSEVTRKAIFMGYTYRWIRPRDDDVIDPAWLATLPPVRRQLLGDGADAMSHWGLVEGDPPLRAWLQERGLLDPKVPNLR